MFSFILLVLIVRIKAQDPTSSGCIPNNTTACTANYAPVCCSDGNEYSNMCNAAAQCQFNCVRTDGSAACLANYDPVCCPDGKKYSNSCQAAAQACQFNCTICPTQPENTGDCNGPKICALIFAPVCCKDGNTYASLCNAQAVCAEEPCDDGECPTEPKTTDCNGMKACTRDWTPVCCDGKTYGNQCVADSFCANNCVDGECATQQPKTTGCNGPQICADIYAPICCNGKTYASKCNAQADCAYDETSCIDGECPATTDNCDGMKRCTKILRPVCCDGKQYPNHCVADSYCATNCVDGECPTTTTEEPTTNTEENCEIEGDNPFILDFDSLTFSSQSHISNDTEEKVCKYCFQSRGTIKRCRKMIEAGEYKWRGTEYEQQCFETYCKQRNADIADCDNIGIKSGIDVTECGCGVLTCIDPSVLGSNAYSFGVFIGIAFVCVILSWM